MSFIIACIMIFILLGIKVNDKAATEDREKRLKQNQSAEESFLKKYRSSDKIYSDAVNKFNMLALNNTFESEIEGLLKVAPNYKYYLRFTDEEFKRCGLTKKERELEIAVNTSNMMSILQAKHGCVSRNSTFPRLPDFTSLGDNDQTVAAYKWYEETLVKGGMRHEDAKIVFIPGQEWSIEEKRFIDIDAIPAGRFEFYVSTVGMRDSDRCRRLWD